MDSIDDINSNFSINLRDYISQNFQKESKDKLFEYLQAADIEELISSINCISKHLPSFYCIPKSIAQFREKLTVFDESVHDGNSISFFYKNYRSCCTIFSIFIEAFLSKPITFDEFCQRIQDLLPKLKNSFIDIIIKQHKNTIEEEQSNEKKKEQFTEEE